jgi:hypothetical protein
MALICPRCGDPINLMVYAIIAYMAIVMSISLYNIVNVNLVMGMVYLMALFVIPFFILYNDDRSFCDDCYPDAMRDRIAELMKNDEYLRELLSEVDFEEFCIKNPMSMDHWITHSLLPILPAIKLADENGDTRRYNKLLKRIGHVKSYYDYYQSVDARIAMHEEQLDMDIDDATYRYTNDHDE